MTLYDEFNYTSKVHRGRHIERLYTTAFLRGLKATTPSQARVLELGCGTGENLIPMALEYPNASFRGIDISAKQLEAGQKLLDTFNLKNVTLNCLDLLSVNAETLGSFDYILCNGMYSWCPPPVQDAIMTVTSQCLSENGVALISYNTKPGSFVREMARDIIHYYDEPSLPTEQRVIKIREVLSRLEGSIDYDFEHPYAVLIHRELSRIRSEPDHYIIHEVLATEVQSFHVSDFLKTAGECGLQFLGDALFSRVSLNRLLSGNNPSQGFQNVLQLGRSVESLEQTMDFIFGTSFRETILCKSSTLLDSEITINRITSLAFSSYVRVEGEEIEYSSREQEFVCANGRQIFVSKPLLKAALEAMKYEYPSYLRFPVLLSNAQVILKKNDVELTDYDDVVLAGALLEWMQRDILSFSFEPPVVATRVLAHPKTSPLIRHQAETGKSITNLFYETVEIEPLERAILPLLDGYSDNETLIAMAGRLIQDGKGGIKEDGEVVTDPQKIAELLGSLVTGALNTIRRAGLLVSS